MDSLTSGRTTRTASFWPSASLRFKNVGFIIMPPLTSAPTAISACNGATLSPWPKAIVIVLSSLQRFGTSGSAFSGNSVRSRSSWPILLKNALWPSTPTISAMRAVAMLEECVKTSGTVRMR